MVTTLVIAGHGWNTDRSFDPGATGFISKGEHKYYTENFFPAVRKYLPDGHSVVLFSAYNVYDSGNIVSLAKKYGNDTRVIEMHYDATDSESASGGHVIINKAYDPDELDLKLRDWIRKYIGVRYSHRGHAGISGRDDLRNPNLAKSINYRLVELGFGTNRRDADIMTKKVDALAKDFVIAICGRAKEPAKPAPTTPNNSAKHTVKSGDTLWSIATRNGMTVNELVKLNPGVNSIIRVGQVLNLGVPKTYTVKSGDTLSQIGARLGIDWKVIANKNGLKSPYTIVPGDKLKY